MCICQNFMQRITSKPHRHSFRLLHKIRKDRFKLGIEFVKNAYFCKYCSFSPNLVVETLCLAIVKTDTVSTPTAHSCQKAPIYLVESRFTNRNYLL